MRTIQEVGTEILTGNPANMYVMIGQEYGIKMKYIKILANHYKTEIQSYSKVSDVLNLMKTKHLIPLQPSVYVVRYDEEFVSTLKEGIQRQIHSINIIGTLVCIYDAPKHSSKLEKYLPDYTVSIDAVSPRFMVKYLHQDFPGLADNLIEAAVELSTDYGEAQNMCSCMIKVKPEKLCTIPKSELSKLFGHQSISTESEIRKGIAARNFRYLMSVFDKYEGTVDDAIYTIMSTMVELDKIQDNKYTDSEIRQYLSKWKREDIYYMFVHAYNELKRVRSGAVLDGKDSLIYLCSLVQFSQIPSPEDLL